MKTTLLPLLLLIGGAMVAAAGPALEDKQPEDAKELVACATRFWDAVRQGDSKAVMESGFAVTDDAEWEASKTFAVQAKDELEDYLEGIVEGENKLPRWVPESFTTVMLVKKDGRWHGRTIVVARNAASGELDYETIAWVKTPKEGWKVLDI
jgi:hypothetical protein